jgi:hypothetical protein
MTPDCFTAAATWFVLALVRETLGPLLQPVRHTADAATHIAIFMTDPLC